MEKEALQRMIDEAEAKATVLWKNMEQVEIDVKPHTDRLAEAKHAWCEVWSSIEPMKKLLASLP